MRGSGKKNDKEKNMSKYTYTAIFTEEEQCSYSVHFPDIPGCYTQGDDIYQALENAGNALALMLWELEESGDSVQPPTPINKIKTEANQLRSLVNLDTQKYRKLHNNRAVKKTLSIPQWLNEVALEQNINFSQTLQEALVEKLGL